jgi:hypothetical protein
MTKDYKLIALWLLSTLLITACSNDGADGSGVTNPNEQTSEEIRFNADVWKMAEATRATMYDGGTLSSGSFTVAAYLGNSTDVYFSPTTVNWVTDKWVFSDGKHYWPMSGNLDFFAYMPADLTTDEANYISIQDYVAGSPSFTCTVPMTNAGQASIKEFIYALTTNQNKTNNAAGVNLTFKHPFARIELKLSSTQANIHINTITFKDLKKSGTCSFDGTTSSWTPTGDATNFVVTLDADCTANDVLGTDYIMIPQTWSGVIEVNAIWTDWDESVAHTVSVTLPELQRTWVAGTSYTYTFTITETDLIVNTSKYTEQW